MRWNVAATFDKAPPPKQWLATLHPGALSAGDALCANTGWQAWKTRDFPSHTALVVGGTPCPPFSRAGAARGKADKRSDLLVVPLEIAHKHDVSWVLQENVAPLFLDDASGKRHGCYTGLLKVAASLGYVLVYAHTRRDSEDGGFASRHRVFILFEKASIAAALRPAPPSQRPIMQPGKVSQVLLPHDEVKHLILPNYTYSKKKPTGGGHLPTKIGEVCWTCPSVQPGAAVLLKKPRYSRLGRTSDVAWYVQLLDYSEASFRLTDEQKNGVTTHRNMTPAHILKIVARTADVYSPDGVSMSATAYYEFPRCGMMLIGYEHNKRWIVRPMHPLEMWRVQQLPEHWYHELRTMGASDADIVSFLGNCIAKASLVRELQYVHDRVGS
jgi:site-specific DNA-cytosine methylase